MSLLPNRTILWNSPCPTSWLSTDLGSFKAIIREVSSRVEGPLLRNFCQHPLTFIFRDSSVAADLSCHGGTRGEVGYLITVIQNLDNA